MQEMSVWSLSWEGPLEKETATCSSILAWEIPWMEEPGRLQSIGLQRVRHNWATSLSLFTISSVFHQTECICFPILRIQYLNIYRSIREIAKSYWMQQFTYFILLLTSHLVCSFLLCFCLLILSSCFGCFASYSLFPPVFNLKFGTFPLCQCLPSFFQHS